MSRPPTEEQVRHLLIFFRSTNVYWWRERRESETPREYRFKRCMWWNRRCLDLVPLGLAVERRSRAGYRFFSPTLAGLQRVVRELEGSPPFLAFEEMRLSFLAAPDEETRRLIERSFSVLHWQERGVELPISWSFAYLLQDASGEHHD